MKQDPSRGGGSTLSPAYSAALERLAKKRLIGDAPADEPARIGNAPAGGRPIIGGTGKGGLGIVGDALNMAKGIVLSPVATAADIAWKPFEAIPGAPDFNPEDAGTVNLFVQGGKSLKHVTGDAYQLGRSIITGKDTLSESPTAKAWKAAGGGLPGVLAVAGPYLDVGSVVAPMAMGAARGAGLVAPVPVPYEPLTVADLNAARETFGAPTNAYRTTRKALAEDMAQAMTADELRNFAEKVAGSTQQVANLDNGLYGVWGNDPVINDRLRGDYLGTDVDEQIKLAQEFFTRVPPLQRPVKAFRGIMVERPEAGTNAFSDFVRTWEVGDVIEEPGFMSTTIDRNIAEGYANGGRVIEIDIPKGTQVATPEMFGPALRSTEQELTLPPGTKLQITSITDDVIKAKVVPSDTPITKMQTTRDALLRYVNPEVTAPQAGRTMNPVEELASAQAQQNVVPLFPEQPPSPSRLRVTNAKLGQSDVADLASYREARDPTLRRFNKNAGDDLYPVGTQFLGKPGAPGRNEAMRKFNAFSQVYEFKFDPKDGIDIEDFIKEGVSAENYDLFTGLLSRAESYKIPRSEQFKVALANFVQRMGGDAVIVNDELIVVPRGKTFKDYLAEDEFGLSAIDITPTNRRTMNPVEELASAKARAETAPVVRDTAAEGTDWRDPKVFDVGGERVVFGPPELDISSVKAGPDGVRVVPIDPYELSNLKMGTEAGDKIADDFTIAMGVDKEMASALLYAGSRGNKSAMAQFEQLVKTGRAQLKQIRAEINSKPKIPDEVWATTTPDAMVNTGKTVRPANIDDLFLVHETAYAPPTNQAGDVMLSPVSAFRSDVARDTVHFALNKVVEANTRVFSGDNRYIVVVPLRDVLDANPGSLDNLLWGDTFLTPKPGEGLRLPSRSVKVLTNPDANEVAETLAQVAAAHNKSPDYQLLRASEVGGHTTEGLTNRIRYLADRIIPEEYPEYLAEITSSLHVGTPAKLKEYGFGFVDPVGQPIIERMSPNQRKRFFRSEKRFLARDVSDNKSIEDIWS